MRDNKMNQVHRGWGFPLNSKKAHYFINGQSLCHKWLYLGALEDTNDDSPDNCAVCRRKLLKIREKEKETEK